MANQDRRRFLRTKKRRSPETEERRNSFPYIGDSEYQAVPSAGARCCSEPTAVVSHDEEFVRELNPTKVLLMPDGDVDYYSEEWLDLVSMA